MDRHTWRCSRVGVALGLAWSCLYSAQAEQAFDQTLTLQGITFHVTSPNLAKGNTLKIVPKGLQLDNSPFSHDIEGQVTGAEVADINADRSPEIYVYVRDPGANAAMSLVAYSANKKKSLSSITLPPLAENPKAALGYAGHDDLAVVEGVLLRSFPLIELKGASPKPSGKTRQIQYNLRQGEAGWLLKISRVDDF